MGKNGFGMQKLSQKEVDVCSLEKEAKSPKMGKKNPYKGKSRWRGSKSGLKRKGEKPLIADIRHIRLEAGWCI